jgi:limonene-1,2-epoxide hydrolase
MRDWDAWARKFEQTEGADAFEALFAPGGLFQDPVTPPTADVRGVVDLTDSVFPDWRQQIHSIRGGDGWAVFEWTGTATYGDPGTAQGDRIPIVMHGATVIEVDDGGLVTRWRDYLDTNEPLSQIQAGGKKA